MVPFTGRSGKGKTRGTHSSARLPGAGVGWTTHGLGECLGAELFCVWVFKFSGNRELSSGLRDSPTLRGPPS